MTRGSRHKSSRHRMKDAKEFSDSEDYSSPRDQRSKENGSSRVLKDSASSEKRKFDSKDTKDLYGLETEGRGFSKRGKERYDEGTTDRWNGGSNDELGVPSKKSKLSVDLKSKRRDESVGLQCDGEELKKISGKGEGRHRELSRKEGKNGGGERERKGREGKSDRVVVSEEHRVEKQVEKNTGDVLTSSVLENHLEIRTRRASSFDGDTHKDDVGDSENRQSSSKNDVTKDGKRRSDKHKDDRNQEKCWENDDRGGKHRDEQLVKDHVSSPNHRDLRHENDAMDLQQKRSKPQNSDLNRELTKAKVRESDLDAMRDKEHDQDHRSYERDRDQESRRGHNRDRDRDHDYDRHGSRNHSHSRARDRYYDYECDPDRDESHLEDQYMKYKESKGRKRSPNDHDDSIDTRSKSLKNGHNSNEKNKTFSDDLMEPDARRGRSESKSHHADGSLSSHRQKDYPSSLSCVGMDTYRHPDQKDLRDQYSKKEERSKSMSNRDQSVLPGAQEKGSESTYVEKPDEAGGASYASGLLRERSLKSKNIDTEDCERRGSASIDAKDLLSSKNRQNWDFPGEKPPMDESSQAGSSSYTKASQSNPSSFHLRSGFRSGVDVSFDGSLESENRLNSNIRLRRNMDPILGRVHGNTWRGVPNWTGPLPNGFIPFQHGPPHGSFQSIMPQFPAPPMFGIRPSLEINHSGIPCGMPDAERFPSHLHPLGWQNMLDGSSPSHLQGWDGHNGTFRDESRMYNGTEWDENRQMVTGRGWESRADMWRRQSGYLKRELPSHPKKNEHVVQDPADDILSKEVCDESPSCVLQKTAETMPSISSSTKESPSTSELLSDTPAPLGRSMDNNSKLSSAYLSKLEISAELANPELHHQCGRLMEIGQSATLDEESAVCIIVEGGAIAVSMSSNGVHRPLFHPAKNSVFQRAVDLYNKQRMEMKEKQFVTEAKLDVVLASSPVGRHVGRHEEQGLNFNDEKLKGPPSTAGFEISYEPISTTDDDKKAVETTGTLAKAEDIVSTARQAAKCLENSEEEEPLPVLKATEADIVIPSNDTNTTVDVKVEETANGNGNGNNSTRFGVGNGPLCFSDEIPAEVCALIFSRIPHSPESTH